MADTGVLSPEVQQAAERLRQAGTLRRPCRPIRDLVGRGDLVTAYAVQRHVTELQQISGAQPVGRKIGLTSQVAQRRLGVKHPVFGTLLDTMAVCDGNPASISRLLQPMVEAVLAVRIGTDLDGGDLDTETVRSAIVEVSAAFEVVDSRIIDWDLTIVDTVADNASTGLFVVPEQWTPCGDRDLRGMSMTMRCDGRVPSSHRGLASVGDPVQAVTWLAAAARDLGWPLRAGEIVLAGGGGPAVAVREGLLCTAVLDGLPQVSVSFSSSSSRPVRSVST